MKQGCNLLTAWYSKRGGGYQSMIYAIKYTITWVKERLIM